MDKSDIAIPQTRRRRAVGTVLCLCLALVTALGLPFFFSVNTTLFAYSNSVLSVLVFVGTYFLFRAALRTANTRLTVISAAVGLLFALFLYMGNSILTVDNADIYSLRALLKVLSGMPFFAAAVMLLLDRFPALQSIVAGKSTRPFRPCRTYFITWAVIFLAWIPMWIASYPGANCYDSANQLYQYANGTVYTAHPMIHTYLVGFFAETVGGKWLGSRVTGFAFYSIFQMLCMSAAYSAVCCYLRRRSSSPMLWGVALAFFALMPSNPLMACLSTKDSLFAAVFALMVMQFCRIAENDTVVYGIKFDIAFVLSAFGQMIFRNQGKYIFVLVMLFTVIGFRKRRKRLLILFACTMALYALYAGPVTKLCHAMDAGVGIREMMSVPCVQLSRAKLRDVDELTAEEHQLIAEYVPDYAYYDTVPGISDNIKATFNTAKFKESPMNFIKLWVKVGIKSPRAYIDAWARLSIGLWYPDMNYPDNGAFHTYWEVDSTCDKWEYPLGYEKAEPPEGAQLLTEYCQDIKYGYSYQKIPVVSQLFSSAMPFWLLILCFAVCLYHRKYRYLVPGAASLALWLTELLGPVVLYRYVYPLMVATPVLIGALLTSARNGIPETKTETAGAEAPASIESAADTETADADTADTEAPADNKETDSDAKS